MHFNDKTAYSDVDNASIFNEFFESVYSKPKMSSDFVTIPSDNQPNTLNSNIFSDLDVFTDLSN